MQLRVACGKGQKTRLVPMSPRLLHALREYWKVYRPPEYRCDQCHFECTVFNSCGDRHCPQCAGAKRADWLESTREHRCPNCDIALRLVSRIDRPGWNVVLNGPHRPDYYNDA